MQPNDPRHGTHAGSVAGCKNECCRQARRRYDKQLRWRHHNGPVIVPSARARDHVTELIANGMVRTRIAQDAGLSTETVTRIHALNEILATTEQAILNVRAHPGRNCFPAELATRRLRALIALGHPATTISDHTGIRQTTISMMLNQTGRTWNQVRPDVWERIDNTYRQLHMTPGTSERSKARAKRNGWAPPLAYEDIDDINEHPYKARREDTYAHNNDVDHAVVERFLAGEYLRTTVAERREIMRRWIASGRSERSLCSRTGWREGRYTSNTSDEETAA